MLILVLKTKYTSEMEKAFQQTYGVNYAEYNLSFKTRLEVEKARELEHKRLQQYMKSLPLHR